MSNTCQNCGHWEPSRVGNNFRGYCPVHDMDTYEDFGDKCLSWQANSLPILDEPLFDEPPVCDRMPAEAEGYEGSACAGIIFFGALLVAVAVLTVIYLWL